MDHPTDIQTTSLSATTAVSSIADTLRELVQKHPGKVTFSSSFSFEDQVILDIIAAHDIPVSIFTLDTGRHFPETYAVWTATREKYNNIPRKTFTPDYRLLEPFVQSKGPNAFYESVENRKSCCHIRKVEPLRRALAGNAVWVTGLRAAHSGERSHLEKMEWDEGNQVLKYHPLLDWTTEAVREYINKEGVPYNILHDRGFVSIGCAPCTRAIRPGEDFRAGRWWWESSDQKECGLHERA